VSSGLHAELEAMQRKLSALDGQGGVEAGGGETPGSKPAVKGASRLGRPGLPPRPQTPGGGSNSDGSRPGSTASVEAGPADVPGVAGAGLLRPGTASLIAEAQAVSGSMPGYSGRGGVDGERASKVITALVEKLELIRRERDLLQRSQSGELNRLRQEVSVLKAESKNMYAVLEENRTLREKLKQLSAKLAATKEGSARSSAAPASPTRRGGGASPRGIGAARSAVREELEAMRAELRSQGLSSDGPGGSGLLAALEEGEGGSGSDEYDDVDEETLHLSEQVDALEADINAL